MPHVSTLGWNHGPLQAPLPELSVQHNLHRFCLQVVSACVLFKAAPRRRRATHATYVEACCYTNEVSARRSRAHSFRRLSCEVLQAVDVYPCRRCALLAAVPMCRMLLRLLIERALTFSCGGPACSRGGCRPKRTSARQRTTTPPDEQQESLQGGGPSGVRSADDLDYAGAQLDGKDITPPRCSMWHTFGVADQRQLAPRCCAWLAMVCHCSA